MESNKITSVCVYVWIFKVVALSIFLNIEVIVKNYERDRQKG